MEKTLQEKLKEQGTQGSVFLADIYEFGSLNGFTEVGGDSNRNITGELLEKIIQWHKNPNKIFFVLDYAHSEGPSTTYGKLCFSKYNWQGYSNSEPSYMTYVVNYKVSLHLNVDTNNAFIQWNLL